MKIGNLEVYGIIYKIENLVNGKVYIGQTTQGFNKRYNRSGKDIERVYKFHNRPNKIKEHMFIFKDEYEKQIKNNENNILR